jgi:hypothetical protein
MSLVEAPMNLIAALFFRTPFWVQFALAAGLVWFGMVVQEDETNRQAARAALLQQAPPATIPITAATPGEPSRIPVELSVTAQVATDHNTRLVQKTNFIKTGESLLYVLVDPAPGGDPTRAEAAMIIDPDDLDAFAEWLAGNSTDYGQVGPIATVSGLLAMPSDRTQAREAMQEQGMVIPDDFFFIEPFFKGREASLAAIPNSAAQISWPVFGAAGLMALIGLLKLKRGRKPKPVTADPALSQPGTEANALAGLQIGQAASSAITRATPARSPKPPKSIAAKLVMFFALVFVIALISGQSWAYAIMPMLVLGLMYLGMRNGIKSVTATVSSVVENLSSKKPAADGILPAKALPTRASVQAPAPVASAEVSPPTTKPRPSDGGPIRPGFSFSDLLPTRKAKAPRGDDPFERLTQSIRAEKEKQRAARQ